MRNLCESHCAFSREFGTCLGRIETPVCGRTVYFCILISEPEEVNPPQWIFCAYYQGRWSICTLKVYPLPDASSSEPVKELDIARGIVTPCLAQLLDMLIWLELSGLLLIQQVRWNSLLGETG
jgi:hypothetical protein